MSNNTFISAGIIHRIGAIETTQGKKDPNKTYKSRQVVITIDPDDKYPQAIPFKVTGELCENLDNYTEGSPVTFKFQMRGNEWNGKFFANLEIREIKLA